jgi:hypothetical protein
MWRAVQMAAAVAALVMTVGAARADVIETFDVSGTYTTYAGALTALGETEFSGYPAGGSFSGSLSLDLTTATLFSANLDLPGIEFVEFAGCLTPYCVELVNLGEGEQKWNLSLTPPSSNLGAPTIPGRHCWAVKPA